MPGNPRRRSSRRRAVARGRRARVRGDGRPRREPMTRKLWTVVAMAALAVGLIALPTELSAQSQAAGGAIEGTITDQSGAVLPGVTLTIRNTATGIVRETTTDATGLYRAPLL